MTPERIAELRTHRVSTTDHGRLRFVRCEASDWVALLDLAEEALRMRAAAELEAKAQVVACKHFRAALSADGVDSSIGRVCRACWDGVTEVAVPCETCGGSRIVSEDAVQRDPAGYPVKVRYSGTCPACSVPR